MEQTEFIIDLTLPLRLNSPNKKQHWTLQHKQNKINAQILWYAWAKKNTPILLPCTVTITRLYPRIYDDDNLIASAKFLRDEISSYIFIGLARGVADGSDKIKWVYKQEKSKLKQIRIQIKSTV